MQTLLVIVYENRSRYVHRIHQHKAFANRALVQTIFNLRRDVDEPPPSRYVKPKFFAITLHSGDMIRNLLSRGRQ